MAKGDTDSLPQEVARERLWMQEEAAAVGWETLPSCDWEGFCKPDCERVEELWRRRKAQHGQSLAIDRTATETTALVGFQ